MKEKSSDVSCRSRLENTQLKWNASRNQVSSDSKSPFSQSKNNDVIEDGTQKQGGMTSSEDPINVFYHIFKVLKERNNKILEMRNYFKTYGLDFTFPIFPLLNIFDNSAVNTILPLSICSNYCTHSLRKSGFSQPSLPTPNRVIGYEIHNCGVCLESESLPLLCDPNSGNVFKTSIFVIPMK
jgi:hypothetical protein